MSMRRICLILLLAWPLAGAQAQIDNDKELMVDANGVAANGYDVVAYFDNRVARGIPTFLVEYKGADWYFESPDNAEAFRSDPAKYEPAYGGWCAYGVAQGYLVKTDPDAWSVVDGRLYLNYNELVRIRWLGDRDRYIKVAEQYWPKLID